MRVDRFRRHTIGAVVAGHPVPVERYSYEGLVHVWDVERRPEGNLYFRDYRPVAMPDWCHMKILEHFRLDREGDDARSRAASHYTPTKEGQP